MSNIEDKFKGAEAKAIERARDLLKTRMKEKKKRYVHSLGVAETAYKMAKVYDVSRFDAAAAGLIHDWDKVLDDAELMARAVQYGIEMAGSPSHAVGLLHGPVAAVELPELFPEFSADVFQAVARHTVGAIDMSPLDMIVFTADAIEPNRHGDYAERLRKMIGKVSLDELYFTCFSEGLVYVLQTGRYLYPKSVEIYNDYVEHH